MQFRLQRSELTPAIRRIIIKNTMQATQRKILELIHARPQGIDGNEIATEVKKNIDEVNYHLQDLEKGGFIELARVTDYHTESWLPTAVTPRGKMVLQGKLTLDDRGDAKPTPQTFNITNAAPVGAQQFGNHNRANVTQNVGSDLTEVLQLIEALKQEVGNLSLENQDVAAESLQTIEEEITAPTRPVRLKSALFALWSVSKDVLSFANAVTALAQRFDIHLPLQG